MLFLFWTCVTALEFVLAMGIHGNFQIQVRLRSSLLFSLCMYMRGCVDVYIRVCMYECVYDATSKFWCVSVHVKLYVCMYVMLYACMYGIYVWYIWRMCMVCMYAE